MKAQVKLLSLVITLFAFVSCQKEYSLERGTQSIGSLQKDATGDCLPKTVNGTYVSGQALNPDVDYIDIQVDVTTVGTYQISTSEVNGIKFSASGNFTTTGLNTVRLKGSGTPTTAGPANFTITYSGSSCDVEVTILPAGGGSTDFTFNCGTALLNGVYTQGVPLDASNTITVEINAAAAGAYTITLTGNGMTFSGSGDAVAGPQTITLNGSGTPLAAGDFTIPLTNGTPACDINLTVEAGTAPSDMVWEFKQGTTTYSGTSTGGVIADIANTEGLSFNGPSTDGNFSFLFSIRKDGVLTTGDYNTQTPAANAAVFLLNISTAENMYISSIAGGVLTIKITLLDRTNKVIQGTFSGTALNAAGSLVPVSGSFKGPIL